MMALYTDPDTGQAIATHSMIKTFRRCPKQAQFKYAMRLKPKRLGKPLRRGTWVHKLIEVHSLAKKSGASEEEARAAMWEQHARLVVQFNALFDEEKDELGDLPSEIGQIMRSYLWHYALDPWRILEAEFVLETTFPDGTIYRAKIDLLIENQFGLWIVDHKTHKSLPSLDFRLLDAQSALYLWAALRNKIPVQGHIWNYIRWKAPTIPQLVYVGTSRERLSVKAIETDYPTYLTALKKLGLDPHDYASQLTRLKAMRYQPGGMQTSPFFRRDVLEKSKAVLKNVASAAYRTAVNMNTYDFDRPHFVERVVENSCTWGCSYTDVCTAELMGGNLVPLLKNYKVGDPMDYYYDDDGQAERKGEWEQ